MNTVLQGPVYQGNPSELTMFELVDKVLQLIGRKPKLTFLTLSLDVLAKLLPDILLARERLDWAPLVALLEGFKVNIT